MWGKPSNASKEFLKLLKKAQVWWVPSCSEWRIWGYYRGASVIGCEVDPIGAVCAVKTGGVFKEYDGWEYPAKQAGIQEELASKINRASRNDLPDLNDELEQMRLALLAAIGKSPKVAAPEPFAI